MGWGLGLRMTPVYGWGLNVFSSLEEYPGKGWLHRLWRQLLFDFAPAAYIVPQLEGRDNGRIVSHKSGAQKCMAKVLLVALMSSRAFSVSCRLSTCVFIGSFLYMCCVNSPPFVRTLHMLGGWVGNLCSFFKDSLSCWDTGALLYVVLKCYISACVAHTECRDRPLLLPSWEAEFTHVHLARAIINSSQIVYIARDFMTIARKMFLFLEAWLEYSCSIWGLLKNFDSDFNDLI